MDERNLRLGEAIGAAGADWAILTGFDSVCYATGHVAPIGAGPLPFCGGPAVALVDRQGRSVLVASDAELDPDAGLRCEAVVTYEGFAPDPQGPPLEALYLRAATDAVLSTGCGGQVGVEPGTFPQSLAALAPDRLDLSAALRRVRATKTAAELELLGACARLTGVGQAAARRAIRPGRTELDVYGAVRAALEHAAGGPVALGADVLSGHRTAQVMGGPAGRELQRGDGVIVDLVPQLAGYWGDSCLTWSAGAPDEHLAGLYTAARAGLDAAAETLRPGLTAGAFAETVYAAIEAAGGHDPIHIGHGIGASNFEYPKLVRDANAVLEPGMVLMVEPGAFDGRGGVRLEWMFEVTVEGNRVLSPYEIPAELTSA